MTRLLIIADMEGISGIERYEQCARGHTEYEEGVRLLCTEINVIAESALQSGARSVSVIDWHGGGGNIDPEQLDERIQVVPEDLSPGYDLGMLIGFHPMAGDPNGFISHTMSQGIAVEVGGQQIGEPSLLAWWLGEHDVPVGLISGDRAATAEADRFFPDTPMHTVKRADSWGRATCIPVEQSYEALRARVRRVLEQRGRWQTYRPRSPIPFRLKLREPNPIPGLIPWLKEDDEGWLAGEVQHARDLIDLIDVISALINLRHRNNFIDALREEPEVAKRMDEIETRRIAEAIEHGHWEP
jgi:D-amino peptidase